MTDSIHIYPRQLSTVLIILLIAFTIINPIASLDLVAFLAIAFILLHKIFGDYVVLVLLAIRPALDYWRDATIFSYNFFNFNFNAGMALLLFGWSVYMLLKYHESWKRIPFRHIWIAFLAWCALSFIWSYDKSSTVTETLKTSNLFTLFAVSYILYQKDGDHFKKNLYQALVIGAIIPIAVGLYQLLSGTGVSLDGINNRIFGTFAHPNILATFAVTLFMVLTKEVVLTKNRWAEEHPFLIRLAFAVVIGTLVFTYTRIAWIAWILFVFAIAVRYYHRFALAALATIVGFYILFFPTNAFLKTNFNFDLQSIDIISRLTSRNTESDSIAWRADLFNKVIPLWQQRPLIGYGYGSFSKVWDDNKGVANIWDNTSEAHDDYLKVAFETGIIGLGLFLGLFGSLVWDQIKLGRKQHWPNVVFLASIVVYLTWSTSDNIFHHTPVIWWVWALWGMWLAEQKLKSRS